MNDSTSQPATAAKNGSEESTTQKKTKTQMARHEDDTQQQKDTCKYRTGMDEGEGEGEGGECRREHSYLSHNVTQKRGRVVEEQRK